MFTDCLNCHGRQCVIMCHNKTKMHITTLLEEKRGLTRFRNKTRGFHFYTIFMRVLCNILLRAGGLKGEYLLQSLFSCTYNVKQIKVTNWLTSSILKNVIYERNSLPATSNFPRKQSSFSSLLIVSRYIKGCKRVGVETKQFI